MEKTIFQEVAHEALKACIDSIVHASSMIKLRKTKFDGQLFLIKHLLILREQITPFNIVHSSSETSLDFSHYGRQDSLKNLVINGLPEVKELHMDYRFIFDESDTFRFYYFTVIFLSKFAIVLRLPPNLNFCVLCSGDLMKKIPVNMAKGLFINYVRENCGEGRG